jgi:hypothetical protein
VEKLRDSVRMSIKVVRSHGEEDEREGRMKERRGKVVRRKVSRRR